MNPCFRDIPPGLSNIKHPQSKVTGFNMAVLLEITVHAMFQSVKGFAKNMVWQFLRTLQTLNTFPKYVGNLFRKWNARIPCASRKPAEFECTLFYKNYFFLLWLNGLNILIFLPTLGWKYSCFYSECIWMYWGVSIIIAWCLDVSFYIDVLAARLQLNKAS